MVITQPLLVAKVQQGCRVSISHKILCSEKPYFFFDCKIYNHDKFSSDISCQGIEEFEYLPSIRPKFEYIPSIRPKGSYIAFID